MTRDDRELRRAAGALAVGLGGVRLAAVADPRGKRGRKWPLAGLLRAVLVGMLAGKRSLKETESLTDQLGLAMRDRLRLPRRVPDTTMREALVRLPLASVLSLLHGQIRVAGRKGQLEPVGLPCGVLAVDGKCVMTDMDDGHFAQRQGEGRFAVRTMTCTLVSAPAAPVVHLTPIPAHTNEMGIFQTALREVFAAVATERIGLITADAGLTGKENARFVHDELRVGYLLALKDNQSELHGEAVARLGKLGAAAARATTRERIGKARHVRRVWLARLEDGLVDWEHARTLVRVEYELTAPDGTVRIGNRYFISSEREGRFTPEQWLAVVRKHWRVENDAHKTLDVVLGEDDHPWIRDPAGMLVLQVLRRIACNALNALRSVTLKPKNTAGHLNLVPWRSLLDRLIRALLAAQPHHLDGLRWPPDLLATLP